ncbi:hypothetical protein [Streptomyces xanthophaeus]|uniref:hypothetical protein n=1 Tax=Streptomyces xanthophaeus TaxID=67385 RepID=UPI002647FFE3|nr:hypothetical protein [Streptomyces xanthophaeus]WKD34955.1 hypothetical protein KO717_25485 [Streptomyces xanthophaeus]
MDGTQHRPDIALWWALGIEAVGLLVGFGLAEPTSLRPDHSGGLLAMCVLLIAGFGASIALVLALAHRQSGAAWWAAASTIAPLAVLVMLMESGMGDWFTGCAIALLAAPTGAFVSLRRASRSAPEGDAGTGAMPGGDIGKAATALAAVALVASLFMGGDMEDVDFTGTWTADRDNVTLTLTDSRLGDGQYTLQREGCSEEGSWTLDNPPLTTSVKAQLHQDTATTACLPGTNSAMLYVAGGTVAAPVLDLRGPDGTRWTLTRG